MACGSVTDKTVLCVVETDEKGEPFRDAHEVSVVSGPYVTYTFEEHGGSGGDNSVLRTATEEAV